jgi:Nucleoporin autopeptidase
LGNNLESTDFFNSVHGQAMPGRFHNPSEAAPSQPGMQQFQGDQLSHSPHQQNIPLAPHLYGISPHMPVQPMPAMATLSSVTSINSFEYASFVFQCNNGSIFRKESESKDDDHLPTTPARVQKVVAPKDEVADGGYYTSPPMNVIAATASVPDFIVGRKGYGRISFKSPVDITDVVSLSMLREIIEIERGRVTVYPDESKKPSVGTGLNVPAEVTLENVRPLPDFEGDEYIEELLRETSDTTFVSYNLETGVWVFTVEHFSSYSASTGSNSSSASSPIMFYRPEPSTATTSSQIRPSPSSSRPAAGSSVSNQQVRRSERLQKDHSTVMTTPSPGGDPTARFLFLTREKEAERLFKALVKEYKRTRHPPDQPRTQKLLEYADVLSWSSVSAWMDHEHLKHGVFFDDATKQVTFVEIADRVHEAIIFDFHDEVRSQIGNRVLGGVGAAGISCSDIRADFNRLYESVTE